MRAWQTMMMGYGGRWEPPDNCLLWLSASQSGDVSISGTWADNSGNGNNATLVSNAYVTGTGTNRGLVVDGLGSSYASLGNCSDINITPSPVTVCVWAYTDSVIASGGIYSILGMYDSTQEGYNLVFDTRSGGHWFLFYIRIGSLGNAGKRQKDYGSWSAQTWYFLSVVFDTDLNTQLYWNGSPLGTLITDNDIIRAAGGDLNVRIGDRDGWGGVWPSGRLDGIMIFNSALTSEEISDIYTNSPDAR